MADQFTYQRGDLSITSGTNSAYNNATAGNGGGGGSANNSSGGGSSNSNYNGGSSSSNTTITTTQYKAVVIKEEDGSVYGVINPGDSPSIELQFTFPIEKPNVGETTFGTEIGIEADVFNGSAIKYITEFESGFINGPLRFTTDSKFIKFERQDIGTQYSSTISYKLGAQVFENRDVQVKLAGGTLKFDIVVTKNNVSSAPNAPKLSTNKGNSFTWNINDTSPLLIPYSSIDSDYVQMSLGKIQRQLPSSGELKLTKTELQNIGQYTLYLQPVSAAGGSGNLETISINVISKSFLPGPDITNISYPEMIRGKDFAGFNVGFDVSWASINTNFVDIYVSKKDSQFVLGRFSPSGAATFNVNEVLRKSNQNFDESTDKIRFKLLLVPTNIEGDESTEGAVEEIEILFDKGDLRLQRGKVVSDIREAFNRHFNTSLFKDEISNLLTHYLHFGNGDNKLISTWGIDTETFAEYEEGFDSEGNSYKKKLNQPKSLVLKLYEPLPTSIQENQTVWISKVQSIPMIEQISIVGDIANNCTLLQPNFSVDLGDDIGYQILDDLIASGSATSTDLVSTFVSSSGFSLDNLDIQFVSTSKVEDGNLLVDGESEYWWSNFVKYSSARERVDNFMYKVKLIEFYTEKFITSSEGSDWTGSVSALNEANSYVSKISKLKNDFDSFEKFLYISSSEYTTNDAESWTYPYDSNGILLSTDSIVTSWYESIYESAEEYDRNNKSNLVNNLPQHIQDDDAGQEFILFFNMIGQHFDILWTHIKGLQQSKKLENKFEVGIKDDLVYHMLESLGWDADMGAKSQFLWEYAFGTSKDGAQVSSMSGKDRQQEIWRRLLNNLPYLNKHKGTKRALHAAMACYGIPASLLTVMEFGGPQDPQLNGTTKFTFEDRTAALNFTNNGEKISVDWKEFNGDYPNSVEFRINTTEKQNQVIAEVLDGWKLEIESGSNYLGNLKFSISSSGDLYSETSSQVPIFYDDFYHIAINRTISDDNEVFDIYIKEGFNGRIRNSGSLQLSLTSGSTSWGNDSVLEIGGTFIGSIDEFRLWTSALSESRIDNHALIPDGIDGNHISASTVDLIFRNDFEYPKDRNLYTDIKNVAYLQAYQTSSVASGFVSIPEYPYNYTPYDRDVTATVPQNGFNFGNKFRFETQYDFEGNQISQESNTGVSLDYKSRATKKSFDTAPIDTDRLGLFFSPIKEINMDILKSLGNFNIDDYIGNPSDEYQDKYSELDRLRKYYFERFDLNFNEYIQLVRYIDKSLFDTLESLVPARAKVSSGLLIEPHILERSKVKWTKPTSERKDLEVTINTDEERNIVSTFEGKEVTLDATNEVSFDVTNPQYEGIITDSDISQLSGERTDYEGTYVTTDNSAQYGFMTVNSGSDMGGIVFNIDAQLGSSLTGEYDSDSFTQVGMDPDSISVRGFGLFGSGSHSIRTYIDVFGNTIKERVKIFNVKESYQVDIPQNIHPKDSSLGREFVTQTLFRNKVTILPFTGSDGLQTSTPSGDNIVSVTPLNGYFSSHYRNVGDLTTGLENSYFRGSKQTQLTTLDGSSPIITFTTNPNTLRVNETGRGSGEPILIVE
jgi:hypothetical protein